MIKNISYFLFVTLFVMSVIFTSCGAGVQEHTNPVETSALPTGTGRTTGNETDVVSAPSPDSETENSVTINAAGLVLSELCDVVGDCFTAVSVESCGTAVDIDINTLAAFGTDTSEYSTFTLLQTGIDGGDVTVSSTGLSNCVNALEAISCSDVGSAFDENDVSDFSSLQQLVPNSLCGTLFSN